MTRVFNKLHFVDPAMGINDLANRYEAERPARPIMITGTKRGIEYRRDSSNDIGTIGYLHEAHKVSPAVEGRVAWLVDQSRNHVLGVIGAGPENHAYDYMGSVIFPLPGVAGVWGFGYVQHGNARHIRGWNESNELTRRWLVSIQRRSDGKPVRDSTHMYPEMVFPAARWASTTFPASNDSPERREQKLELAEAHYNMRRAEYGLQVQAHRRHWGDSPRAALEDHGVTIPRPVFSTIVTGSKFAPRELSPEERAALRQVGLSSRDLRTPTPFSVMVPGENGTDQAEALTSRIRQEVGGEPYQISDTSSFMSHLANS